MAYNLILQGIVGSTAYGLATENSDIDQIGVFVQDITDLIGLFPQKQSHVSHDPDVTVHEAGKYISLAAKSNPTVLELMYVTDFTFKTTLGQLLIDNRNKFLSTKYVRAAYGGYASSQLGKIIYHRNETWSDAKVAKFARHCMRLVIQGQELLGTGSLTLNVSDKRDYLFECGQQAVSDHSREFFRKEFMKQLDTLDHMTSVLPDEPDWDELNDLLQEIRWRNHDKDNAVLIDKLEDK